MNNLIYAFLCQHRNFKSLQFWPTVYVKTVQAVDLLLRIRLAHQEQLRYSNMGRYTC